MAISLTGPYLYDPRVKRLAAALAVLLTVRPLAGVAAIDLDVTPQDIERALAVARGTDSERAAFHRALHPDA